MKRVRWARNPARLLHPFAYHVQAILVIMILRARLVLASPRPHLQAHFLCHLLELLRLPHNQVQLAHIRFTREPIPTRSVAVEILVLNIIAIMVIPPHSKQSTHLEPTFRRRRRVLRLQPRAPLHLLAKTGILPPHLTEIKKHIQ
jgi:hypothetical protein